LVKAGIRLTLVDRSTRARRLRRLVGTLAVLAIASFTGAATSQATATTFTGHVDAAGTSAQVWSINVTDTNSPITGSLNWTNSTAANLNLFLTGPGSSTIIASAATMNRPETINFQPTVTGTYKFRVKAVSGAADYTLQTTYNTDTSGGPPTPVPTNPSTDWPMWHNDQYHLGVSADGSIGASNAASMGLDWAVNTGNQSYISPVVYHSSSLNKTLVYVGNQLGSMSAYNANTGDRQWVLQLGASIQSSPAIVNNVIYFGANDHKLYAVNASTGAVLCSFDSGGNISSSPVVVDPNGTGLVVYFGENGLTGGDDGGAEFAINAVDPNAAANCSQKWVFTGFNSNMAGSWSPPAFGVDKNGNPLVVFGGSSPDCGVYAVNAVTGNLVWRFQTLAISRDDDVGAGPTITPPGANGFADGVVYVAGKDNIIYALNLRTGVQIWSLNVKSQFSPSSFLAGSMRSTAIVFNNRLYVGYGDGVYAVDAVNGSPIWRTMTTPQNAQNPQSSPTSETLSSPALTGAGAPGGRVMFVGDVGGVVRAIDTNGNVLWSYTTGQFVYSSPAIANGHVYIASGDGFLYAFAPGGAIGPKPDTAITSPSNGAAVQNTTPINIAGTATDNASVSAVNVAVNNTKTGQWWNAATQTWSKTYQEAPATLSNPGAASTNWTSSFVAPFNGGEFKILASSVDGGGQHDPLPATVSITVSANGNPPHTTITSPTLRQVFHFPLQSGDPQKFDCDSPSPPCTITITGTATDSGGAHPGIAKVQVIVKNIQHSEYYCGPDPSQPAGGCWQATSFTNLATLTSPGANSTNWSLTFQVYDHPHQYRITAFATDLDGETDPIRAVVNKICVNDPGDNTCI
jgi:outer membrane protein assembly factor BamB